MALLGKISVNLTASTARFEKGLARARKRARAFGRSIGRMGARAAKFGAVAGGVAVTGLAYMTSRAMSSIDATAKLSDRIGITTERLAGLRHAAEITGAGAATMDKSLQFMAKTLGEAETGIGEGKQALEKLGLSLDALLGKRPDEQFALLAERVSSLATQ